MTAARKSLVQSLARAEHLRQRNEKQARDLETTVGDMADHATGAAEQLRPAVLAGDPAATGDAKRALFGRALARRLLGDRERE